eukprot:scaffold24994_cov120-Isochrysis_galbana.AAC.1
MLILKWQCGRAPTPIHSQRGGTGVPVVAGMQQGGCGWGAAALHAHLRHSHFLARANDRRLQPTAHSCVTSRRRASPHFPLLWEIGVNGPFHSSFPLIKKVETRDTLAAARRDTSVHYLPVAPPLPSHSFPTPFSLFRPSISEGWCQSCVHYNSLGWGIESLGFSVVLDPSITLGFPSSGERTMEEL